MSNKKKTMTVGELKKILKSLDDDLPLYIDTEVLDRDKYFYAIGTVHKGEDYAAFVGLDFEKEYLDL